EAVSPSRDTRQDESHSQQNKQDVSRLNPCSTCDLLLYMNSFILLFLSNPKLNRQKRV
ncbi:hypothetical protein ABG768_013774, partial [Culter alburnus]